MSNDKFRDQKVEMPVVVPIAKQLTTTTTTTSKKFVDQGRTS